MKKLLLCACVVFAYADLKGYYESINKDKQSLAEFKNPFFVDDINEQFHLQAIFENKAKINEQWYQLDESINGAKLVKISQSQGLVLLEKDTQQFQLSLKRLNHKIQIH